MGQAVFLDAHGEAENFRLRDHDAGEPGPGAIRVRNTAIGLNFIDIYQRRGLYPVTLPAILGQEGAGIVEAVGEGVTDFHAGDRVAYLSGANAYASETICSAGEAAKIPEDITDETAAAVFLKGLTAHMLVRNVFDLRAEHNCLVYAAAGGVGTLLTQWAANIGARVIAVVGSDEKAEIARTNGANDVIVRTRIDSISREVRRLTDGRGVDIVYDSVGAATFEDSLESLAILGHMVTYGNASGPVPPVNPLDLARRGSLTLTRPILFHYATPERLPAMAASLFTMIEQGALKPAVSHRFRLEQIADAHQLLESGDSSGAIVIVP